MFRLISRAVSLEATPLFDRFCLLVTWVPEASVVRGLSAMQLSTDPCAPNAATLGPSRVCNGALRFRQAFRWDNTTRKAPQRKRCWPESARHLRLFTAPG
jgi:hypothetical protein